MINISGIFGIVNGSLDDLFRGTDYNSHLGTAFGGLAVLGKDKKIHLLNAQFKSKFEQDVEEFNGAESGIGAISAYEPQPLALDSQHGHFKICTNGNIFNIDDLAADLLKRGWSFTESFIDKKGNKVINPTEVAGKIIAKEDTVEQGIEKLFNDIYGSLSLLLLTKEGIYAARAGSGHSPLIIGRKNGSWAVTGETCAFSNLKYEPVRELKPGEIVLLTNNGPKQIRKGTEQTSQICSFLWIYTSYPASTIGGINVEEARYRCGAAMARRDLEENPGFSPDIIAGVPDSGTAHAIGYANATKFPFKRPLVKYTDGYGRSYIPSTQEERDATAFFKLITIPELIIDMKIVLCEDSIVRGTQLKDYTMEKLREAKAKEVHVRPACPPLMFPCIYNISTKRESELIARKMIGELEGTMNPPPEILNQYLDSTAGKHHQMVEMIRKHIGVTSLKYLEIENMLEAIGLKKERACTYCWTGEKAS